MRLSTILSVTLLALTSACATTSPGHSLDAGADPNSPGAAKRYEYVPPQEEAQPELPTAPLSRGHFDATGSIWDNPDFSRSFVESFLSETDVEPHVTLEEQKVLQSMKKAMAAGKEDKAIRLLMDKGGPQSSSLLDYNLGQLHFGAEQLEEASACYTIAVEKFPKFRRAWKNLGFVKLKLEDYPGAAKALSRVIELGGGDGLTYGYLGYCYANTGQAIPAESAYRMATLLAPETLDWKMGLARTFFAQQNYGAAQALCAALIVEQPESMDLWLLQANAFIGMGEPMKAAENLELVDRMGGSSASSLNNLGDIYLNEKLFDLSVLAYVRSLELEKPKDFSRVTRAARALSANEEFDEVLHLVHETKRLRGADLDEKAQQELLRLEAGVALARGEAEAEAKLLKEIIRLNPLDGEALIYLGRHSERSEEFEQAIFYYERAANIERFEGDAKRRHGQLLVRRARYVEALVLLRRAQSLKPSNALLDYIEQVEKIAKNAPSGS